MIGGQEERFQTICDGEHVIELVPMCFRQKDWRIDCIAEIVEKGRQELHGS